MAKTKIKYICSSCGYESLRWIGKCPECDSWNSFVEELVETNSRKGDFSKPSNNAILTLKEIVSNEEERIKTNVDEFDRVLGGGLFPGSIVLLAGDPGIGKSTLALQVLKQISESVLYITGEESYKQIKLRADRLKIKSDNIFILAETNLNLILNAIHKINPSIVIIDSIQTLYKSELDNSPGSVTQIRECALLLMEESKKNSFNTILIGHVTKEGYIAGPKVLEHIVDTVVQFEGENNNNYRILRTQKNRYGNVNEIGVFEMREDGLREVTNPSEFFLSQREKIQSGSTVTALIEGTRPILFEIQALTTPSSYGNPQRVATGFDFKRLSILLAVIEKRANLRLSMQNVFVNAAGGIKVYETAADLAVCCCIASSLSGKEIDNKIVILGEVGLGGEIRSINHLEKRIQESEKLGFEEIIIPKFNVKGLNKKYNIKLSPFSNLKQVLDYLLD